MKLLLLLLITSAVTINAQLTPPPGALPPVNTITTDGFFSNSPPIVWTTSGAVPKKLTTYSSQCPYCGGRWTGLPAQKITTNGQYSVTNGVRIERAVTLKCPATECQKLFDARNDIIVVLPVATEDQPSAMKSLAPVVLPDTNAPSASIDDIRSSINDFTNRVNFKYQIGHFSYWHPQLGLTTKMFEVTFTVKSNFFYTAWHTDDLNHAWTEFPTDQFLHPARSDGTNTLIFPINPGNHYYTLRAKISNGWTYQ